MKINAIVNTNFKGLYGTAKVVNDKNYNGITLAYNYYPFKDETEEEIENEAGRLYALNPKTNRDYADTPPWLAYSLTAKKRLPFTRAEYETFQDIYHNKDSKGGGLEDATRIAIQKKLARLANERGLNNIPVYREEGGDCEIGEPVPETTRIPQLLP